MKNLTLAILFAAGFLPPAMAQSYSDAANKDRKCSMRGDLGVEFFLTKKMLGKTMAQHVQDTRNGKLTKPMLSDLMMVTVVVSQPDIRTQKDAYLAAWAECMDEENKR